jgi:uncharacterized membrane protein required for colicin V production
MFLAALPTLNGISYNYVDGIIVAWLLVGILRGRKRGMTQELLPTSQWVAIVILAGLFYGPVGGIIFQATSGAFNHLWSNITAYVAIAFIIHLLILWLKQGIGEKLIGSDYFGRAEYYLGMIAGLIRFACMFVVFCALMHSRVYTAAELAETERMQKKNFEDIRFPTYGSIQHAVLSESFVGHWLVDNMDRVMISTTPGSKPSETIAQKREDSINAIIGTPKK